ncbi:MAG: DUF359 domain-containing protein, partial [Candidatus Nanohaloarchaea archaeon]|nr:DUF359 domain-containing protein [Candidatus Nanohaloarchaea archaeon]
MEAVYRATEEDRERLRDPRSEVVEGEELPELVDEKEFHRLVAVGDRVSLDLFDAGREPDISILDGRIQREEVGEERQRRLEEAPSDLGLSIDNPAGEVTEEAWRAVREAVARDCRVKLRVEGEEDLLALPSIIYSSPDSLVVYGQRNEGAVVLGPGEELKRFVRGLVGRRRYGKVIVGGSWEFLHAGHRSLLLEAF